MTRREEIQQAIQENGIAYCDSHPEMNLSLTEAFVMGAVWADSTMIDKAVEWFRHQKEEIGISWFDDYEIRFRQAMKEE